MLQQAKDYSKTPRASDNRKSVVRSYTLLISIKDIRQATCPTTNNGHWACIRVEWLIRKPCRRIGNFMGNVFCMACATRMHQQTGCKFQGTFYWWNYSSNVYTIFPEILI